MTVALFVLLAAAAVQAPAFQSTHPLTGRHIANVMGFRGADWLERPERESEENVEGALNAIGLSTYTGIFGILCRSCNCRR